MEPKCEKLSQCSRTCTSFLLVLCTYSWWTATNSTTNATYEPVHKYKGYNRTQPLSTKYCANDDPVTCTTNSLYASTTTTELFRGRGTFERQGMLGLQLQIADKVQYPRVINLSKQILTNSQLTTR